MTTAPTLLVAHEGKSGSFMRWLEKLGLTDFLKTYPLRQLVEWGWVVPQYRVAFSEEFFRSWKDYPNTNWNPPENLRNHAILWDYFWLLDGAEGELWFLDPIFRPSSEVGALLRQHVYEGEACSVPAAFTAHPRGVPIIPYADYFYRWQGYALVDVILSADVIQPIYATPDVLSRADGIKRIAGRIAGTGGTSPQTILTADKRWGGLAPLMTWLDHFRSFKDAVFNDHRSSAAIKYERFKLGAKLLAEYFNVSHEILAHAIKNNLLRLANDWLRLNERMERDSIWTLRAWPHLQADIHLAMVWLIQLSGRTLEEYDAEWRKPYKGHWGWLPLDKALPYDFMLHQKRFAEYVPSYMERSPGALSSFRLGNEEYVSTFARDAQRDNPSFAGFLAAFYELHENLSPRDFGVAGLDFRELRPLDHYALLVIRAEGCFRYKLESLEILGKIPAKDHGLVVYIKELARRVGVSAAGIDAFNSTQKSMAKLHGEPEDPIGRIQSMPQALSDLEHQLVQAFLCCVLARNYFAHHTFLDDELHRSEKSAFMLRGILVSVLVLLRP